MPHDHRQPPHRYQRRALILAVAALVAVSSAILWRWSASHGVAKAAAPPPAVQVTVAAVERRDMPIYVSGLGAVQASVTVTIRSQVDGKLQEVLFTEGQHVKKGDVLAKIDPRLFQAALDQAKAKKAQDEAQLIAAEKDLERYKTLGAEGLRDPAEHRPAAGQGRPAQGVDPGRRGGDRDRADATRLHHHRRAERRPHRHPPGRSRQHRARGRPDGARHPDADPADRGDVHAAGAASRRCARGDAARPGRGHGLRRTTTAARWRPARCC